MRASILRGAMVAATIVALCGCRSGASMNPMKWGRKSTTSYGESSGPQLPSASTQAPAYGATAQATPGAADPAAAAGYANTGYPDQMAGYTNPPGAPNTASQAQGYAPAAGAMTQNGPYSEHYAPPQAAAAPHDPYAAAPHDPYAAPPAHQAPAAAAHDPYAAAPAAGGADPYAAAAQPHADATPQAYPATNAAAPAEGNYGPPAERYGAAQPPAGAPAGAPADPYANTGYGQPEVPAAAPPAQGEQAAADRYAAAAEPGLPPAADTYQPGNTGYDPGNTGYAPPGVQAYPASTTASATNTPRRDPYYRPGGTTDYALPAAGGPVATMASAPPAPAAAVPHTDRYGAPVGQQPGGAPNPYVQPSGGYQPPAQGTY